MDLYKLLKSLEEFLYEVIVLLVFYPRTLWLTLRHPQRMMDYADTELGDVQSGQYTDTVSPPLFLMLSLGLSYMIGVALHVDGASGAESSLLADPERLLIFRVFVFSLLPLTMSLRLLHDLKITLDRDTLRPPFYSQCFVTAPFALVFSAGITMASRNVGGSMLPGLIVVLLGSGWYVRQQSHWFAAKRGTGLLRGWLAGTLTFLLGIAALITVVLIIVGVS